jgi:lactate dehydrogenase-like 2-hydroxyacid dehydrogenase
MEKQIFITRKIPQNGIQLLQDKGYELTMHDRDDILSTDELIQKLSEKHYDGVISQLTNKLDGAFFDMFPHIKIYANYATGFDNISLPDAKARGITITNAPTPLSSNAVAEFTIAMMYALSRRIVEADMYTRSGKYTGWNAMNFLGTSLAGKTLALIGTGQIGSRVAAYAKMIDMDIMYTDVHQNKTLEEETGAKYIQRIEDLLPQGDIISLHVPLLESTHHLLNKERISLMKSSALLINTARGPVIDEDALTDALLENRILGAALDVFEREPQISDRLKSCTSAILTPHIGSANLAAREAMAETVAHNIIDFFEGKIPRNIVI